MSLRDKVFSLRAKFKKSNLFYINNPSIIDKEYFGIFEDRQGNLHYDFGDTTTQLISLRNQRIKNGVCRKYKILYKQDFIPFWFDYEFWGYCMTFSESDIEASHYAHKIDMLKQKIPLL